IGGLVIYVACFAFGLGPIFWLLISEIYPLTLVGILGRAGTFWFYGVIAIGAGIFLYLLVPETKGKMLEQIEAHWRVGQSPRSL
ncbi:MAG: MFS transporter, partial [Gemmatimonadales bacterium]